jgi:tetratricopeptide (TPR) repeat protein
MRGAFHRFALALTDLDTAAALGGDRAGLDAERATIYQALGRYDEALAIRRLAVDRHADFSALAALAGDYGERGEMDEAERWFSAATRCYRGTSPSRWRFWSSSAASCGWSTTISAVPAPGALRRSAGFRSTFPRTAT